MWSAFERVARTGRVGLTLLLFGAISLAAAAQDLARLAWQADFARAQQESRQRQGLLLVCLPGTATDDLQRASELYGDRKVDRALEGVTRILGLGGEHDRGSGTCALFGVPCAQHRACERDLQGALFGGWNGVPTPQHLLLFPDGEVAWQDVGVPSAATLIAAVRSANEQLRKGERQRLRAQVAALGRALRTAHKDEAAYHQARTILALATPASFAQLWPVTSGRPVAERLVRDLGVLPAERADGRLLHVAQEDHKLGAVAQKLLADLRSAGGAAPAPKTANRFVIPVPSRLPAIGRPASLCDVRFAGDATTLEDGRGKITVLWFFLPDWPELPDYVERFNAFADEVSGHGVRLVGLGASLDPDASLRAVAAMGFRFPVGTYAYSAAQARCGVTLFPSAVVVDPDLQIVYQNTHYTEFEGLVRGMLRNREYAGQLVAGR